MPCPHIPIGLVTCFSTQFWNNLCEPQFADVRQYANNLKDLRDRLIHLRTERIHVDDLITRARGRGENTEEMRRWVNKAIQIEQAMANWEKTIANNRGCCHALHLDWRSRHRLSRDARKMIRDIQDLRANENFIRNFSSPPRDLNVEDISRPDFLPLASSMAAIEEIMDGLKSKTKTIIGVYGAGGIGKTRVVEQVAKRARDANLFDKVIIALVSHTPNVKLIQDRIAEHLGFKIEEEGEYLRQTRLSGKLKQVNKVLIILDNVWEVLDLVSVGIPYDNEHEGCKIIVTSRFLRVCNGMNATIGVPIQELSEEDALKLFKRKAGNHDSTDPLDRAAREMVRQCRYNPNLILTVGSALRNKPPDEWNAEIQQVRESTSDSINIDGISEEVLLCIKLGYDKLELAEANQFLLFCCLFPAYHSVSMEELVIYGLVDSLFPNVDTLGDVWNRMHPVINHLKSSNLLLEGDREGCFRVHDDTRKVVEYISSERGHKVVVRAGQRLTGCPAEGWGSCQWLSLMDSHITSLPDRLECPELVILFLQNNALWDIPPDFFVRMTGLTYLDMSYTFISKLPWSLCLLKNLRSLRLENTRIEDASLLRKLNKLEVLILRGSCVEKLPKELEKMTNLKILDLSNNLHPQEIPSNVISKLSRLEELYIGNSFGEWEVEGTGTQCKASFSEVASLASLTVLHIHVKNKKSLSIDFDGPWGNLRKFRVCVNDDYWDISSARSMHVEDLSYPVANWTKLLLEKTEHLALARSRDLDDIVQNATHGLDALKTLHLRACSIHYIFRSSSFPKVENLEELHVEYCYSLKEVFHLEEIEEEHAKLTRLRELILVGLPKMTAIWKGNLSAAHLENLKLMKVKECGKLENLFPKALAQKVHQLVHLTIMNCDNMEEIISSEGEQEATDIPTSSNMPPPMCFKNLRKLTISKCKKIKSILALKLVRGLEQLEELVIASCNQLEEIISMGEEREEEEDRNMLPQLKILSLQNLPNLGTLYKGELLLKWHSLDELQAWNCPNLKTLPLDLDGAPELRKFKGQEEWFNNLNWTDEDIKARLQLLLNKED